MRGNIISFKGAKPDIKSSAMIFDNTSIIGNVEIAQECSIWYGCVLRGDVSFIKIGARSNVQDLSVIHVGYPDQKDNGAVYIGEDVTIGHQCIIHACRIEDLCLVGMGSIVMDGVHIGKMSIVGAGSLITKDKVFPPKSLIMGNPARLIRELNDNEINAIKHSAAEYVQLAKSYF
ncbi:gamma carbonic anhydrase family protein [Helicobacter sp. 13S00477-4]|uniref:gamma carbonic anhydrase family protein n=1 Tax=Helicobacter sp. 13S00477-4 TaxID=1905759 RepID=UPI000BD71931|nr:gamma carbonic anhydrase family protein [Helicobacter sp. 13S00477-4]PAF51006.1 gamma carbonic anhydrase family protein [Helicobacter sp. 13S00477-4]